MVEQKFKTGDKVMFKGEQHEVVKATYTYFPDGAWWVYELENGAKAAARPTRQAESWRDKDLTQG